MAIANDPILVTGAAGFIGYHVAQRLLEQGREVVGIDNLNAYYDPALKRARLVELERLSGFRFERCDIADRERLAALFSTHRFPHVIHLAAQAGVRHSLIEPHAYADANLVGFLNILEGCRQAQSQHLVYAASSSVYGGNSAPRCGTSENVDHPLSLYGATKKANELMAHAYAHLFDIPATGLRLFTVYGPWGRPDMAMWRFTQSILEGRPILLFNNGQMKRDFTYVDDVAEAVVRLVGRPAQGDPAWNGAGPKPATSFAPWRIYNVGHHTPVAVTEVVRLLEETLGKTAIRELAPMQPGDVHETCAEVADLEAAVGFRPKTPIAEGVRRFVQWSTNYAARN